MTKRVPFGIWGTLFFLHATCHAEGCAEGGEECNHELQYILPNFTFDFHGSSFDLRFYMLVLFVFFMAGEFAVTPIHCRRQ